MRSAGRRNMHLALVVATSLAAFAARAHPAAAADATSAPTNSPPVAIERPGVTPGTFIGAESTVVGGAGVIRAAPSAGAAPRMDAHGNDYPTVARADYVFACMQVNGQSRDILERCSCSIDVIASLLPFDKYEEAETIMSVRQRGGKSMGIWDTAVSKEIVKTLKRAQIEGELRCF